MRAALHPAAEKRPFGEAPGVEPVGDAWILMREHRAEAPVAVDPRLEEVLRASVAVGGVLVLLWPGASGTHSTIGWMPLWLVGMPLVAWWAAHRFRLPGRA